MSTLQKYFIYLLLLFSPLLVHANEGLINECQSDIYFANGILTDEGNATKNLDLVWKKVLAEQYDSNLSKMAKELNFKTAYNQTYGFSGDIYEAYLQLANENDGWGSLYLFVSYVLGNTGAEQDWYNQALALITGMNEVMIQQAYEADLSVQIEDYKNSIALGHSAIVIAHSQGNLFTNDAYKNIIIGDGSWRKEYFTAVAVASPATKLLEDDNNDPHIGFDNDPVAFIGTLGTTQNPNRSYKYRNVLGELIENSFDKQFHSFNYYMGEIILLKDGLGERNVSTNIGKVVIMNFLKDAIENHRTAQSQWETNEEFELNTCEYKITIKHRYDPDNITMDNVDTMVYPFEPNKKLYQVNGEWVKASCGGKTILPEWDGKKENECWMIDNPQEEKIAGDCGVASSKFEIISHHGWGTRYWWVTIKIIETNEIIDYVTPFNLNGSLYRVNFERGYNGYRWVIASCGGTQIFEDWEGKKDHEEWMINNPQEEKTVGRYRRDNENEIVINTVEDIMWQDNSEVTTIFKSWITVDNMEARRYWDTSGDTASTYCENLILGGYSDWRLPNAATLYSLYRFLYSENEASVFKNFIASSNYWTSSTYQWNSTHAMAYYYISSNNTHFDKSDNYNIRCMRGNELGW